MQLYLRQGVDQKNLLGHTMVFDAFIMSHKEPFLIDLIQTKNETPEKGVYYYDFWNEKFSDSINIANEELFLKLQTT